MRPEVNAFNIARECFNNPEQYSIVSTRAQMYIGLHTRGVVDLDEYVNLIDDLYSASSQRFVEENNFATKTYFEKLKRVFDNDR